MLTTDYRPHTSDKTEFRLGPFHPGLPGQMLLGIQHDGEVVIEAEPQTGFVHRGLEKRIESVDWAIAYPFVDRIDPEAAAFSELSFCLALESLFDVQVPDRASWCRMLICELARISAHLRFVAKMSEIVNANSAMQFAMREREAVLDLFERFAGARFAFNYIRVGGVSQDSSAGVLERVAGFCKELRVRLKEYGPILLDHTVFQSRTKKVGVITKKLAVDLALSGPNARASGLVSDVRLIAPYSLYSKLSIQGCQQSGGGCFDRFKVRFDEIFESIEAVEQCLLRIQAGEFIGNSLPITPKPGKAEACSQVESSRGRLMCRLVSEKTRRLVRARFVTPSTRVMAGLNEILHNQRLEDVELILASLDIGISEVDR